jgi:hypothetical protein
LKPPLSKLSGAHGILLGQKLSPGRSSAERGDRMLGRPLATCYGDERGVSLTILEC